MATEPEKSIHVSTFLDAKGIEEAGERERYARKPSNGRKIVKASKVVLNDVSPTHPPTHPLPLSPPPPPPHPPTHPYRRSMR